MAQRGIVALALSSFLAGCGAGESPHAGSAPNAATSATSATSATALPADTAAAARAAAAPAAPAAAPTPITSCTLGESVRVIRERRRPKVVVGEGQIAVVHSARRPPSIDGGECEDPRIVQTSPFPFTETSFSAPPPHGPCESDGTSEEVAWGAFGTVLADAERDGGTIYTVHCYGTKVDEQVEEDTGRGACTIKRAGETAVVGNFADDPTWDDFASIRSGLQIAHAGTSTIFAVAFANTVEADGVYALVLDAAGHAHPSRRLGRPPTAVDLDDPKTFAMTVTPTPDGGFLFDHGVASGTHRMRSVFGPAGSTTTFPTAATIEAAPPPELELETDRSVRNAPSAIRIKRRGVPAPITGFTSEVATFAPRFVVRDGRMVAVWSEGTGTTTRIRSAIIDVATAAVVGPIVDVSAAGIEAGYASIDAYGDRIVVAWDEKKPDGWDVRLATLTCR